MSFLHIQNFSKSYGGAKALNDVSFTLQVGEAVGIIGDNGVGKSTLLRSLSGAIKPDIGNIIFNGQPLELGNPQAIREAGIEMVYQDLALCRQQTVLANLLLGREIITLWGTLNHAAMRKLGSQALAKLNTDIPLNAIVGDLSGGQQQAVAIARAMMGNPKLVILDEPTAALGIKESAKAIRFIQSLTAQGVAVIVVSHRLQDVIDTTSRILLMRQGQIAQTFITRDLTAEKLLIKIQAT
jgi:ABC-type sugar transport system ATPase subunit